MKIRSILSTAALSLGLMTAAGANATPFTISLVTDNDFALFSGTSNSINHLLYQNDVVWNTQIFTLSTLSFNLTPGDDMFYILAMGGGGQENISGLINNVNITSTSIVQSPNIRSFLTGYDFNSVTNGTYNAQLVDVQAALASFSTWAAPTLNTTDIVILESKFGSGYHFNDRNAHLFRIAAQAVDVPTVAAPATAGLLGLGMLGFAFARRRKQSA